MRHRIILDCDTGRDDAIAIALALASPEEIEVVGIATVAGNVPLALTHRNTRFVCELCGRPDVKVHAGAARPLLRPLATAEDAHGDTGLEGVTIVEPTMPLQAGHAVDFMIETLAAAADDSITLVPTGPLTNIALLALKAPELLPKVKQIVLMGGAQTAGGNVTPAAEFNIAVDPHAAQIVLHCGRPVVAFGLDVTYRVLAGRTEQDRLLASGRRAARELAPILSPMPGWSLARFGGARVVPMHDPCTIAWLVRPELFTLEPVNVEIETASELTLGQTVVDRWGVSGRCKNVHWAVDVDGAAVLELMVGRLCSV